MEGKGKVKTGSQPPAFGLWGLGKGHFQGMKNKDQPGWTERENEMRWGEVTACDFAGAQTKGVGKQVCTGKEVEPNTGTSQAHTHSHRKEQRLKKAFSHTRGQTHRHTQGLAKCLVTRASLHTQGPSNSIC